MRLPHIWHTAAFFAYFSKVHISHIFPHILAFLAALNILCSYFSNFCICRWLIFVVKWTWRTMMQTICCCKLKKLLLPIRPIHVLSRLWYAVNLLNNDRAITSHQKCTMSDLHEYAIVAYFSIFLPHISRLHGPHILTKNFRVFHTCLTSETSLALMTICMLHVNPQINSAHYITDITYNWVLGDKGRTAVMSVSAAASKHSQSKSKVKKHILFFFTSQHYCITLLHINIHG